jgi:hypothetical protein
MADTGFKNGGSQNSGKGGQQRLKIAPPAQPPAEQPTNKPSKSGGVLSFLKDHWHKAGSIAVLGLIGVSCVQTDIEHPEHSMFSVQGVYLRTMRVAHNASAIGSFAWNVVSAPVAGMLKGADLVQPGSQPMSEFIVCTNKKFYDQMMAGEPRATAFAKAIQPQLESQARLLAYKDAPFYKKHAEFDPLTRSPAAVFHIPAVPASWHPNAPYVLESPMPMEQKFADEQACGRDEIYRKSPIPGM